VGSVLVVLLFLSPTGGWAWSKRAEKALFAGGLLTVGGVVWAWWARGDARNAEAVRRLRAEWGEPVSTTTFSRGFDLIRREEYRRGSRRAVAYFRNERLERVDVLP